MSKLPHLWFSHLISTRQIKNSINWRTLNGAEITESDFPSFIQFFSAILIVIIPHHRGKKFLAFYKRNFIQKYTQQCKFDLLFKLKIYIFNIKYFFLLSQEPYFGYLFVRSTISPPFEQTGWFEMDYGWMWRKVL